jgi:hypothetical protein
MNCMSSDASLYTGRRAKEKARQEHVRDVYRLSTSAVARFIDVLSALLRLVQGKALEVPERSEILQDLSLVQSAKYYMATLWIGSGLGTRADDSPV